MQADRQQSLSLSEYTLRVALLDFQRLRQQKSLPHKMQIKLQYLENRLLGRRIVREQYMQLPQYELQSLQQCDKNSQTNLFLSIVKCLSGKQLIVYFKDQRAFIKKEESFSTWKKCYLSCDSNNLYIKKKANKKDSYYQFKIKDSKASKKYLEYKKKMCFGLLYGKNKYMLGFEQETACSRIFETLRRLIKQNQPYEARTLSKSQLRFQEPQALPQDKVVHSTLSRRQQLPPQSSNKLMQYTPVKQAPNSRQSSRSILQFQKDQSSQQIQVDHSQAREQQIFEMIKDEVKGQQFSTDKDYKLIRNFQLGRMLVWVGDETQKVVKTKLYGVLSLTTPEDYLDYSWLLQQYLSLKNWNLQIQQCRIINKITTNSYKLFIQFKKYSLISLARWVIAIVTTTIVDKKVYLLIRSCEQITEEQLVLGNYMSTVRMVKFDQTVQVCKKSQKDQKVLMTVITNADFGGYCSRNDNLNMSLHALGHMQNFYNFLLTQAISKGYEQNMTPLFQLNQDVLRSSQVRMKQHSQMNGPDLGSIVRGQTKELYTNSQFSDQKDDTTSEKQQELARQSFKKPQFQSESQNKLTSNQVQQMLYRQFVKEFQQFQRQSRGNDKLVQLIQTKVYQKYYLKHRFQQNSVYDSHALKYPDDPGYDNWLLQKGKWRINGLQLIFTNEEILAQQKNVIRLIIKQLGSNVMSGKNIMNMSLPVEIFQDKSFLQKLGEVYGYFPYYFNLASQQKNIVKQITYVAQAFSFATTICPNIQKPFNPILGQTYQCSIGGVSLYFQQILHHPPISSFYLKTADYEAWGNHNPNVEIGLNTAVAKNINPMFVRFFATNTMYKAYTQDYEVSGLIFGNRTYKNSGKVIVFQQKNDILCELSYGKAKKHIYESNKKIRTGEIIGGVFKVANTFGKRLNHATWKNFEGIKYDEKIQQLAKLHGNWMGDFYIDNVKVKSLFDVPPFQSVKDIYVLPSDCSFRLDVYYKKMGDNKKAQQWKQVMQNSQRKDRKLRRQLSEQHPKKH